VKRVRADARENACIFLRDESRPFYGRARRARAARVVCRSYPGERDARGHEIANDVKRSDRSHASATMGRRRATRATSDARDAWSKAEEGALGGGVWSVSWHYISSNSMVICLKTLSRSVQRFGRRRGRRQTPSTWSWNPRARRTWCRDRRRLRSRRRTCRHRGTFARDRGFALSCAARESASPQCEALGREPHAGGGGASTLDVRSSGPTNDSGRTIHIAIEYRWRSNFVLALTKVVWLRMSVAVVATTPRADFGTNDRGRQSFYHSAVQRNERTISTALDPRGFPRPR